MKNEVFQSAYAGVYDGLYADKDYESECALIHQILMTGKGTPKKILDLGCGTGRHAEILADKGYEVTGVDRSQGMLEKAKERAKKNAKMRFFESDIAVFKIPEKFDAVLMLFAVAGYQTQNESLRAVFQTAKQHLVAGGLFIFDFWYAPAVESKRPESRKKIMPIQGGEIIRNVNARLDPSIKVCHVSYDLEVKIPGKEVLKSSETHSMRYFSSGEIYELLEKEGFRHLRLSGFPDIASDPSIDTWSVLEIAEAV